MAVLRNQIIMLVLAAVFIVACSSEPSPTQSPTAVLLIPALTISAPTGPPSTYSLPTVTTAATATNLLPTTVLSTEDVEMDTDRDNLSFMEIDYMNILVGETVLTATLFENSSVDALKEALLEGPITIDMRDYGSMEKVGPLGMDLPRNDQQITTEAGDIILYQGNALVIYYSPNSWNFTRLGKINHITPEELREILGEGNVTITLSLPQE